MSSASIAINAGALSPIGEPFAMFPPKVAAFLTCVEPYLVSNSANDGASTEAHLRSFSILTPAPICHASCSSSILQKSDT